MSWVGPLVFEQRLDVWAQVEALAERLMEERTLSGARAKYVCEKALRVYPETRDSQAVRA